MAIEPTQRSLADYWSGIQSATDARLIALKTYLKHPASVTPIEGYFRDLVREYLPRRYTVEPGFVVNADGEMSDHLDVIIADLSEIPPLCSEPLLKIYPAEAVVAAMEVTSAPKSRVRRAGIKHSVAKLEDDALKLAKLRRLARKREYVHTHLYLVRRRHHAKVQFLPVSFPYNLAPRTFLILCGDEWAKKDSLKRNVEAALRSAKGFINAVFSMRHGMLWFKPYTDYESEWRPQNGLLEFIFFLNKTISSYQTFRVDISRYRPTLPTVEEAEMKIKTRTSATFAAEATDPQTSA